MLRVSPKLSEGQGQPPVLRIDRSKKRVTVMEPISRSQSHATMTLDRDGKNLLKTFNVDSAYPQESSQVWFFLITSQINSNMVLNGSIGCYLTLIYVGGLVLHDRCFNSETLFCAYFPLCTLHTMLGLSFCLMT